MAETNLVPATGGALPAPIAGLGRQGSGVLTQIRSFAGQPAVAKSLPMLGLLGVLLAAALAWSMLHTPPQRDLFSGLADGDKAAVAAALDTAGIDYTIDNSTGALTVADGSYYRAKMLLAQQGLPKSAPDADSMISSLPMGASRAVEGERLREAREMDLARTIEAIDAVETAKVHIAADQPSVFLRDAAKPQASVMLRLRSGRALGDAQVQAIVHLVAASVSGLAPEDVSVVDQSGRLLSKMGGAAGDDAAEKQVAIQARVEDRYRQSIASLLMPIVGDGNYTAEVHADLDFAEVASTRETYPKDGAVLAREEGNWSNTKDGANKPASGIPGALSNQPPAPTTAQATPTAGPAAPGAAPGQASAAATSKDNESYNRSYELGHEVSVTRNPVGTVRRLTVAVALRQAQGAKPLTPAQQQQIESLVKGAVGFDQQRGDIVSVSQQTFVAADAAVKPAWYQASWIGPVGRNLTAIAVAAILVFGIGRPMLKRRAAVADQKAQAKAKERQQVGREIATQLSEQQMELGTDKPVTLAMIEDAPGYAARAALIRNFVRQDPDRAALVVRDLIRADMPKEAANG